MKTLIFNGLGIFLFLIISFIAIGVGENAEDNFETGGYYYRIDETKLLVNDLIEAKSGLYEFKTYSPFRYILEGIKTAGLENYMTKASVMQIDYLELKKLTESKSENIILNIPLNEKENMVLELTKVNILSPDFKVVELSNKRIQQVQYTPGTFYRGRIKNHEGSIASISVFEDYIMGVLADENGNYNLGPLLENKQITSKYIIYNDKDLKIPFIFKCGVDDLSNKMLKPIRNSTGQPGMLARRAVSTYFVADYRTFLDKNSNTQQVANYITGFFNSVATIYQNEYLPIQIASIAVYTSPDPYIYLFDSYEILLAFGGNTKDNFNGDLAHLLSTRPNGFGGIAWIRQLCGHYDPADSSGRFAFSNIDTTYYVFPTYSWTVTVVAHEMGHNFGSMHTHACVWPITANVIGAIDSCYTAEGGCFTFTQPNYNGTLMSYCHLNGATNLRNGFGPMPGDTVRLRYNQGLCFGPVINSSEPPTMFALLQNYPNPFNPVTFIRFDVPQVSNITLVVYDASGREVVRLLDNAYYEAGEQSFVFNAGKFSLASGVYFYKLIARDLINNKVVYHNVKKMVLIK